MGMYMGSQQSRPPGLDTMVIERRAMSALQLMAAVRRSAHAAYTQRMPRTQHVPRLHSVPLCACA